MVTRKRYVLFICAALIPALFLMGCEREKIKGPKYYFPFPENATGYVYQYVSLDGQQPDEFWHISKIGNRKMRICIMDEFRGWRQCSYEYIASNGIIQEDLWIVDDSLGYMDVEVVHGNLYPLDPIDKTHVYIQSLRWYTSRDSSTYMQVIRNRRFTPQSTKATDLGDRFVLFEVMEMVEDFQEGYLEIPVQGLEVFEKGRGLVHYEKEFGGQFGHQFTFEEKLTVREFEELTGASILSPGTRPFD